MTLECIRNEEETCILNNYYEAEKLNIALGLNEKDILGCTKDILGCTIFVTIYFFFKNGKC